MDSATIDQSFNGHLLIQESKMECLKHFPSVLWQYGMQKNCHIYVYRYEEYIKRDFRDIT